MSYVRTFKEKTMDCQIPTDQFSTGAEGRYETWKHMPEDRSGTEEGMNAEKCNVCFSPC